ncbi:MAG: imidazole glycerol phosphate synthase subunit HisH [candidate division Zixibacteria bacterium]|nr:imidazole glycerol phosphate synthase subunit HisH [candidate division Zixibacteria bacterium]
MSTDQQKIVIVSYGLGNLGSIKNMLKKVGFPSVISGNPDDIAAADKVVLPGVGAFDNGMKHIVETGLLPVLNRKVLEEKTPLLGICLGMQLLAKKSDEGKRDGLGWIDAEVRKFDFADQPHLKIPHMGWNYVRKTGDLPLTENLDGKTRFYFVHSYHVVCRNTADIILTCDYGGEFTCAVQHDNIMGVQFHPEKSHRFGMQLLKNFAGMEVVCYR